MLESRKGGIEEMVSKEKAKKPPKYDFASMDRQIKEITEKGTELYKLIEDRSQILEKYEWWIKQGFGASGMKAYIYKAMLAYLNQAVVKYAERIGIRVKFSVDLTMASAPFETVVYKDGEEVNYEELSGGQQKRVDVCLAFAMNDVVSREANINIFIMDEVFESLDKEGVEIVFDLIRMVSEMGKTVFVNTHLDSFDSLYTRSMRTILDGNHNTVLVA
jgi:DNA repair exonuclease SbcCD ATPase subunit